MCMNQEQINTSSYNASAYCSEQHNEIRGNVVRKIHPQLAINLLFLLTLATGACWLRIKHWQRDGVYFRSRFSNESTEQQYLQLWEIMLSECSKMLAAFRQSLYYYHYEYYKSPHNKNYVVETNVLHLCSGVINSLLNLNIYIRIIYSPNVDILPLEIRAYIVVDVFKPHKATLECKRSLK
ncbi:hypothetical protein NQ317_005473 [Molorchus minor]|uniref:Uncharacterized protein n=1 Tax=Molorchus minor TaxID=1323400 RepID=A0ABQ9JWT5_9CUCU|nr:hypothetical protein NQ317_005473 [Molorchus minor]